MSRAVKGDYNPAETRVIPFLNNPTKLAIEQRALEVGKLSSENEALKTRIKLLEEGQTRDLTMLVGKKMDEDDGGEKVQELKEQLVKADTKNQRLMEAFKKTSQDFREREETCCSRSVGKERFRCSSPTTPFSLGISLSYIWRSKILSTASALFYAFKLTH